MMIKLEIISNLNNAQTPDSYYDFEMDDIRSILTDICHSIKDVCCFEVSGFGQNDWMVTVNTDLPVLLEQLPKVLNDIYLGNPTEIDFYEQGVERLILLQQIENSYVLSCFSQTSWQPNPKEEYVNTIDLIDMLSKFLNEFMCIFHRVAPKLANHQWVQDWLQPSIRKAETINGGTQ